MQTCRDGGCTYYGYLSGCVVVCCLGQRQRQAHTDGYIPRDANDAIIRHDLVTCHARNCVIASNELIYFRSVYQVRFCQ